MILVKFKNKRDKVGMVEKLKKNLSSRFYINSITAEFQDTALLPLLLILYFLPCQESSLNFSPELEMSVHQAGYMPGFAVQINDPKFL